MGNSVRKKKYIDNPHEMGSKLHKRFFFHPKEKNTKNNKWFKATQTVHPWKLTCNPKMKVWKMLFLFKWVIFRFQPLVFRGVVKHTHTQILWDGIQTTKKFPRFRVSGSTWSSDEMFFSNFRTVSLGFLIGLEVVEQNFGAKLKRFQQQFLTRNAVGYKRWRLFSES